MSKLRVVTLPKDNESGTVTPDLDQDVTTFCANEFWQSASNTSNKPVLPSDRGD